MAKKKAGGKPAKSNTKTAAKKSAAKKPAATKAAVKKSVPKKVAPKKAAAKKAAPKKVVAKKAAPKKPVKQIKKAVAKKVAPKKVVAKKVVKKAPVKPVAKKPVVKKAAPKPVITKKAPVQKPQVVKKETPKVTVSKKEIKKSQEIPEIKKVSNEPVATPQLTKAEEKFMLKKTKEEKRLMRMEKERIQIGPLKKLVRPVIQKELPKIQTTVVDPNKTRYSDEELAEFKDLIVKKLDNAKSELKYLQDQISRSSELGGDDDARFKGIEDGTMHSEREYLSQMASRQIQYISHLEKALIRIENKTYGICRETGKLISKERLRAVPHATLSMEAKTGGKVA